MNPRIDHIGMWTWGGRVYHWKKYLDNMHAVGMDSVVLWHSRVPASARQIQEYARSLGIGVIWGFNWSWNSPVCLDSPEDAARWRDIVLGILAEQYAPLSPDGICFQVGGTELDAKCRLDCEVCRKAYAEGVGPLYMKFAGAILSAVRRRYPSLQLYANVHLGGLHKSFGALGALPASVNIMWEDLPGPGWRIEVPFAYEWDKPGADLTDYTRDMVRRMCSLRGAEEDVAFIVKGFPCHWGGDDPMLLEDFDLRALAGVYQHKWDRAAAFCQEKLPQALDVFRLIASSPARRKTVLLLVEHGLWELKRYYPAVLIAEALRDPFREPGEIIRLAREKSEA